MKQQIDSEFHIIHALKGLKDLWLYRELFWVLVLRDIKVRYKQTLLGGLWALFQPISITIIFSLVFGKLVQVPSDDIPYPLFLFSALSLWFLFANALQTVSTSLINSSNLVSKVYFPRIIIPLSSVGPIVLDFLLTVPIILFLLTWFDYPISISVLLIPLVIFHVLAVVFAFGLFFSSLIVKYRDIRYLISFLTQIWMFVTPIVYSTSLIPEKWQWLIYLNPVTLSVELYRHILFGANFDIDIFFMNFIAVILFLIFSLFLFMYQERNFADVI